MNYISNLTAQIKLLCNFDPEGLVFKALSGLFFYSYWLLCNLSVKFPHNDFLGWYLWSPRTKFLSARTYFAGNYLTGTRDRPLVSFCLTATLISTLFFHFKGSVRKYFFVTNSYAFKYYTKVF